MICFLVNGVILIVSKVASSMTDLISLSACRNNQRPLSIFNQRKNEAVQHMKSKEADKEKKQRNRLGSSTSRPVLLSWARSKSDTTEPICLECEIHLISCPGLFKSHESKKLMIAVSFQDTVYTASYSHLVSVSLLTALTSLTPLI